MESKLIKTKFSNISSQEHNHKKSNKLHEFDQLRGRRSLVTLEEESHNSKLSNKLMIKTNGEGLNFSHGWKKKKSHGQQEKKK